MESLGRYKIVGEIGRGGCGVVYLAQDPSIGRTVAIKTIQADGSSGEGAAMRARFRREARAAGSLSHPNIVTVHEFDDSSDPMFIAMEFIDGQTLDKSMCKGDLPFDFVLKVLRSAADALDYAHAHNIVHRDVKPANFLIDKRGNLKIADFGVAKLLDADEGKTSLTSTGMVIGTAQYLSPEQISEEPVTGRSDQFSLAVIAYEMLTGVKPFQGNSWATFMHSIMMTEPPPVSKYSPQLSDAVNAILRKALTKSPAGRYATCAEFVHALELELLSEKSPATGPLPLGLQTGMVAKPSSKPPTKTATLRLVAIGTSLVVVVLAGLVALRWLRVHSTAPLVGDRPAAVTPNSPAPTASQSPPSPEPVATPAPSAPTPAASAGKQETSRQTAKADTTKAPSPPSLPAPQTQNPVSTAPVTVPKAAPQPQQPSAVPPAVAAQPSAIPVTPKRVEEDPAKRMAEEPAKSVPEAPAKRPVDETNKRAAEEESKRLAEAQAKAAAAETALARRNELQAISRVLADYQGAYQRKDAEALQAVWPSIPKQVLEDVRESFRGASEVNLDLRPAGDPEISGSTATVICDRSLRQVIRKKVLQASNRVRVLLSRRGSGWVIQSIETVTR